MAGGLSLKWVCPVLPGEPSLPGCAVVFAMMRYLRFTAPEKDGRAFYGWRPLVRRVLRVALPSGDIPFFPALIHVFGEQPSSHPGLGAGSAGMGGRVEMLTYMPAIALIGGRGHGRSVLGFGNKKMAGQTAYRAGGLAVGILLGIGILVVAIPEQIWGF